ncbi:MAG: LysR family transcriptional regulator [Verrucomicrobia bacterium]|nr:LysR family transcriptional regulator [Verrucomicrobiota bacterium]
MDSADLATFLAVVRAGNITKAAQHLGTVQSNVTTRIRSLESGLGVRLFHRHRHGVTLTDAGNGLLPYAQQIETLLERAIAAISPGRTSQSVLRLGSLETTSAARLPALLKAFAPTQRQIEVSVQTGTTRELVQAVLEYRLDGAFVAGTFDLDEIEEISAFREELVLVSAPQYQSLEAAIREGHIPNLFVFRVGCSYRQRLEDFFTSHGVSLLNQMELGTLEGIIGCVSAGLGVTLLPRSVVVAYARRGEVKLHNLPPGMARIETVFAMRRGAVHSSALEQFIDELKGYQPDGCPLPVDNYQLPVVGAPAAKAREPETII